MRFSVLLLLSLSCFIFVGTKANSFTPYDAHPLTTMTFERSTYLQKRQQHIVHQSTSFAHTKAHFLLFPFACHSHYQQAITVSPCFFPVTQTKQKGKKLYKFLGGYSINSLNDSG